jgi:ribosome-binding factor A
MSQRTDRVDELLRQEIGVIVSRDVADPRVGFATITSVETTTDLRHAKVWVSVIGQPAQRDAAVAALQHAMPFIRHELGKTLRIKRIPDLHVHLDETAERGTRILQLLAEIETGTTPEPDVPIAESLPTPVPRFPQADDLAEEPPSAVRQPVPARPRRAARNGTGPSTARKPSRRTSR